MKYIKLSHESTVRTQLKVNKPKLNEAVENLMNESECEQKTLSGTPVCVGNCLQLPPGHSSLTCNHLPPALIQVRGNHVPHGHTAASTDLQVSGLLTGCSQGRIGVGGISNSVKYPSRAAGKMLEFPPERRTAPALLLLLLLRVSEVQRRRTEAR